jgi:hypothetical protein
LSDRPIDAAVRNDFRFLLWGVGEGGNSRPRAMAAGLPFRPGFGLPDWAGHGGMRRFAVASSIETV